MQLFYGSAMNSRHLETLLWTVRLGGVGAAARQLNLTQPAVTRRIQELERDLGTPLFRREGRNVVPTAACEGCLAGAERILAEVSAMRLAAKGKVFSGTVRAGVGEFVAMTWFPSFLNRIEDRYPDVRLEVDVDLSSRLVAKLKSRQLEIVLVPGQVPLSGAIKTDLGACQFSWMGHPRFLRSISEFTPEVLAQMPIITLPPEANAHDLAMDWFAAAGVKPQRIHYCNSFSLLASLVRKGVGIGLLQSDAFSDDLEAGAMVILGAKSSLPKISYTAAYLPGDSLSILPEIAAFAREESWFLRPVKARWSGLALKDTTPRA
jgi:DNA-binding transcriptional LysR family regulator